MSVKLQREARRLQIIKICQRAQIGGPVRTIEDCLAIPTEACWIRGVIQSSDCVLKFWIQRARLREDDLTIIYFLVVPLKPNRRSLEKACLMAFQISVPKCYRASAAEGGCCFSSYERLAKTIYEDFLAEALEGRGDFHSPRPVIDCL